MTTRYRLDDLLIDVPRQRVERDGVLLDVGGLSFRLLEFLLEQGQRVVGFDELIERVWAPAVVNEETVTQRVRLLRQSLGDDGRNPRYLRSVRGRGYQLCVPPQRIDDASGDTTLRRSANRNPVYVGIAGPSYETDAEIRAFRILGGDLIGMSTVHEAIAAAHAGLQVAALSAVTNSCLRRKQALNHAEVLHNAQRVDGRLSALLRGLLEKGVA